MTTWVLIIWFGSGNTQVFDTQRYDSAAQCEAARSAVTEIVKNATIWPVIKCIEVSPGDRNG